MISMIPRLTLEGEAQAYAPQIRQRIGIQLANKGYRQVDEVTRRGGVLDLPLSCLREDTDVLMVDKSVFHPELEPRRNYLIYRK